MVPRLCLSLGVRGIFSSLGNTRLQHCRDLHAGTGAPRQAIGHHTGGCATPGHQAQAQAQTPEFHPCPSHPAPPWKPQAQDPHPRFSIHRTSHHFHSISLLTLSPARTGSSSKEAPDSVS